MQSALEHPGVVQAYLHKECTLDYMLGPFSTLHLPACQMNRFGVILKGHNRGRWRLITDLLYPPGQSINDGIVPELCSLSYMTVDRVVEVIATYPPGALLAKIDIEVAYRIVPMHPLDQPLQAMEWQGKVFVDPMVLFGLRSAPKLFNAIAHTLEWVIRKNNVRHIYRFLDDFIVIGPPLSSVCAWALRTVDLACERLGVQIVTHKQEGPTTCLMFLGIKVDKVAGELRLLADKLQCLLMLLTKWGDKRACHRRELESLIGLFNHACKVAQCGCSFLRRMLDLLHGTPIHPMRSHPICINTAFRSDLTW